MSNVMWHQFDFLFY